MAKDASPKPWYMKKWLTLAPNLFKRLPAWALRSANSTSMLGSSCQLKYKETKEKYRAMLRTMQGLSKMTLFCLEGLRAIVCLAGVGPAFDFVLFFAINA